MHWNCVTVLFSGIRRNGENLLLFEGNTMVSKDKTPLLGLWAGRIFYWLSSHPEKQGRWFLDVCFYILFFTVHICVLYSFTPLNLKPFPRFECIKICVCVHAHALLWQILHCKTFLLFGNHYSLDQLCIPFYKSLWKKGKKNQYSLSLTISAKIRVSNVSNLLGQCWHRWSSFDSTHRCGDLCGWEGSLEIYTLFVTDVQVYVPLASNFIQINLWYYTN